MMDVDHLRNRTSKLGDDELLKIAVTNSHEYHRSAVHIAKDELSRGGHIIGEREDEGV